MLQKLKILTLLTLISCAINAQKFVYDIDFLTFFDNRESRIPSYPSKTLFGVRLSPEIGFEINDSTYGNHRLMAGASYTQPFGSQWPDIKIRPTIYYRYRQQGFDLSLGFVPWRNIRTSLPDYLFSDSLRYFSPNIQGVHFGYSSRHGFAEFICDWRGMQSLETHWRIPLPMAFCRRQCPTQPPCKSPQCLRRRVRRHHCSTIRRCQLLATHPTRHTCLAHQLYP